MAQSFEKIRSSMKSKPYDFLDQRRMEFDDDYEEFKRQISELHANIRGQRSITDMKRNYRTRTVLNKESITLHYIT